MVNSSRFIEIIKKILKIELRKCWRNFIFEFMIPIIIVIPIYFVINSMPIFENEKSQLWKFGHEFSPEPITDFSQLFQYRNYSDCIRDNRFIGININPENNTLYNEILAYFHRNNELEFRNFNSETELKNYAENPPFNYNKKRRPEICAGLIFNYNPVENKYQYKILINSENIKNVYPKYIDLYNKKPDLETFGWLKIVGVFQTIIDTIIIKQLTGKQDFYINYAYLPMNTEKYQESFMTNYWYIRIICGYAFIWGAILLGFLINDIMAKYEFLLNFEYCDNFKNRILIRFIDIFGIYLMKIFIISAIISGIVAIFLISEMNFIIVWISTFLVLLNIFPYAIFIAKILNKNKQMILLIFIGLGYGLLNLIISKFSLTENSTIKKILFSLYAPGAYFYCMENAFENVGIFENYYNEYKIIYGWLFMIFDFMACFGIISIIEIIITQKNNEILEIQNNKIYLITKKSNDILAKINSGCKIKIFENNFCYKDFIVCEYFEFLLNYLNLRNTLDGYEYYENYEKYKEIFENVCAKFNLNTGSQIKNLAENENYLILLIFALLVKIQKIYIEKLFEKLDEKFYSIVNELINMQKIAGNTIFIYTKSYENLSKINADFILDNDSQKFIQIIDETKNQFKTPKKLENIEIPKIQQKQNFVNKIWAIIWKDYLENIRNFKAILFQFFIPFSSFLLLFLLNTNYQNQIYNYNINDLSEFTNLQIPINSYTHSNKSIENFIFNKYQKLPLKPSNIFYPSEYSISQIVSNFANILSENSGFYIWNLNSTALEAIIYGKIQSPHLPTYFANLLSNEYIKYTTQNEKPMIEMKIETLEFYRENNEQIDGFNFKYLYIIISLISLLFPYIWPSYKIGCENKEKLKEYQILNGLKIYEYWFGKFICDFIKICLISIGLAILHEILSIDIPYFTPIIFCTMISIIGNAYLISIFTSKNVKLYFSLIFMLFFIIVIPLSIIIPMLKLSNLAQEDNSIFLTILDLILRFLIPMYNMGSALTAVAFNKLMQEEGSEFFYSLFDFDCLSLWIFGLLFNIALTILGIYKMETNSNKLTIVYFFSIYNSQILAIYQ